MVGRLRTFVRQLATSSGGRWGLLTLIAVSSLLIGFGEAGILFLVVHAATAIAAEEGAISASIAGLDIDALSLGESMALAGGLLAMVFILSVVNSAGTAAIVTRRLNVARRETFGAFASARWDVQSNEPEARLQHVLTGHVARVGLRSLQIAAALSALLTFVAYLSSAVLVNPLAAVAMLGGVTAIGLLLVPIAKVSRRLSRENADVTSTYSRLVSQAVRMAREVKVFAVRDQVVQQVLDTAEEAERIGFRSRLLAKLTPSVYQYSALGMVVLGLSFLQDGSQSRASELGAIVVLLVRSLSYGQQFNTALQQMAESQPFVESVRDLQETYRASAEQFGSSSLERVERLTISDAAYSYTGDDNVLENITFELSEGESLGIVGPSGSGKSTLMQLLLRLRDPATGRYLVNGQPAATYDWRSWADNVVLVPQENALILGTVSDNIRFFRDWLSEDAVRAAARSAHIHEDIEAMADGYETIIGPGVREVSGGQRQRIGLARALAGGPSVLILDEPTSALDMRSEELIQETLRGLRGTIILVVVAHRVPTLAICDRILVLDAGHQVAIGPHKDLERQNAFYREAVRLSQLSAS